MTTVGLTPRSALRYRPLTSDTQRDSSVGPVRASRQRQNVRPRTTKKLRKTTGKLREHTGPWGKDAANTCAARQAQDKHTTSEQTNIPMSETIAHPQQTSLTMIITTIALAMLTTFILIVLAQIALSWINVTLDDLHYGRPRTFQTDVYVGQEQGSTAPSHFVAMNNKGRIEIIEMPGNDRYPKLRHLGHAYLLFGSCFNESRFTYCYQQARATLSTGLQSRVTHGTHTSLSSRCECQIE